MIEPKLKILIIGPTWLGDMVMAQSLFITLKKQRPCVIDVLAPSSSYAVLHRMAEVDHAIKIDLPRRSFLLNKRYRLAKTLRGQYDQVFVLPNSWKSALIPYWAKIPKRTGWLGELRWGLLNDARKLDKTKYPQMVERYVALAFDPKDQNNHYIPRSQLHVEEKDVEYVKEKFALTLNQVPILALCPGAAFGSAKKWPKEYFAQLAQEYINNAWQVWLFGSPSDVEISQFINQKVNGSCYDFTGKTSITEVVDIMSLVDVVVSNDSGLMHVGSALNKKIVGIYGPTDHKFCPPLAENKKILMKNLPCQPCRKRECPLKHHLCMKQITPEEVSGAIKELME